MLKFISNFAWHRDGVGLRPEGKTMNRTLVESLRTEPRIFVKQNRNLLDSLFNVELANKYDVFAEDKSLLARIIEVKGGFLQAFKRFMLRSHRGLKIDVINSSNEIELTFKRNFFWFFSDLEVFVGSKKVGSVHRRFSILYKSYELRDSYGRSFAKIKSPIWHIWTFRVQGIDGTNLGSIQKKWAGVLKEFFTDADSFLLEFDKGFVDVWMRTILFAAAISIDFDFFEKNQASVLSLFD